MKKAQTIFIFVLSLIIIIFTFCVVSFAHSGKTDEYGGHFDGDTGEYHYHHGYPAHQHENGICPYDYDDKTGESSGNGNSGGYISEYTTTEHQNTTRHNQYPSTTHKSYIATTENEIIYDSELSNDGYEDDNFILKIIIAIFSPIIIALSVYVVFKAIRKHIRKKKCQKYLLILKPQIDKIKTERELLNKKTFSLMNNNLCYVKHELRNYEALLYERKCKYYKNYFNQHTLEELCETPEGIKIIDGEIKDELDKSKYGRYTAYRSFTGTIIHFKYGCSNAYIPINLLEISHNQEKNCCKKCCNYDKALLINNKPQWYIKYKSIKKIANTYNIQL